MLPFIHINREFVLDIEGTEDGPFPVEYIYPHVISHEYSAMKMVCMLGKKSFSGHKVMAKSSHFREY